MIGVSTKTLRRWDRAGKFKASFRTVGNHRRYNRTKILDFLKRKVYSRSLKKRRSFKSRCAIYGRVSSSRQKKSGDLKRQLEEVKRYCELKNYKTIRCYSDVGSGLNDKRRGLLRLLKGASVGNYDVVVVNYNDRLARFGLQIIEEYLQSWGVKLEVIHPTIVDNSPHAELITDLTAILYSFMGKLYRMRRK